jgi:hypothetical protein
MIAAAASALSVAETGNRARVILESPLTAATRLSLLPCRRP